MEPSQIPVPFRPGKPCLKSGFTLVELLVVIVIVAVLAAIAIYATRNVRKKAMQVNAVSSMRQVATFCVAYSTENNGDINTIRYLDNYEGKPSWVKNTFWGRLQPYMFPDAATGNDSALKKELDRRVASLFNTSDVSRGKWPGTIFSGVNIYGDTFSGIPIPFAFNQNFVNGYWNKWAKVTNFSDPSQILHGTFGSYLFDEADGQAYEAMPIFPAKAKNNIYYFEDKTVAAWALDGHVELLKPPIPKRRFTTAP